MNRETGAGLKEMTKRRARDADLEKMTKAFARFVRSPVSITSDVLILTCAALDQSPMPNTLLERNTNCRLA